MGSASSLSLKLPFSPPSASFSVARPYLLSSPSFFLPTQALRAPCSLLESAFFHSLPHYFLRIFQVDSRPDTSWKKLFSASGEVGCLHKRPLLHRVLLHSRLQFYICLYDHFCLFLLLIALQDLIQCFAHTRF